MAAYLKYECILKMPSAFIVFSNENRDQVKQDKPNAKFADIGRELGKRWHALSDEEKSKYSKSSNNKKSIKHKSSRKQAPKVEVAKEEEEEASSFSCAKDCVAAPKKQNNTRKQRRRGGPSAFIAFSNEKREEVKQANPKATFGELGKRLGKMWQALSDEEKQKYSK